MTSAELRKKLKKAGVIRYGLHYFLCICVLVFACFILKEAILNPGFRKGYLISLCFFLMGIYGFWRIPLDYSVTEILCEETLAEKEAFVLVTSSQLRGTLTTIEGHLHEISYSGKFDYRLKCTLFFDEKSFLINVRSRGPGFIDFGVSHRATKEMIEKIKDHRLSIIA